MSARPFKLPPTWRRLVTIMAEAPDEQTFEGPSGFTAKVRKYPYHFAPGPNAPVSLWFEVVFFDPEIPEPDQHWIGQAPLIATHKEALAAALHVKYARLDPSNPLGWDS